MEYGVRWINGLWAVHSRPCQGEEEDAESSQLLPYWFTVLNE